jgi:hypothetical protein
VEREDVDTDTIQLPQATGSTRKNNGCLGFIVAFLMLIAYVLVITLDHHLNPVFGVWESPLLYEK